MKHLDRPPFACLITEGRSHPQNYILEKQRIIATIRDAIRDGIHLIQIREKALSVRLLHDLAEEAVRCAAGTNALIFVNDRADVAIAAGADGVHLPQNSIPADAVRNSFRQDLVIGVSTHSIESARNARSAGADYVFFGPVFDTPGKGPAQGLGELRRVVAELHPFPVIALGGIDETNYESILEAGASGLAAIRAFNSRESRRQILKGIRRAHDLE